jgi:CubicO group peptidase (beta-lactamase class C family)
MKQVLSIGFLIFSTICQAQISVDVENILSQHQLMGISAATVCDGQITGLYHAGKRHLALDLPVNDSTKWRVASISKMVTAIGLMKLYDQNLFQLDDDISDVLGYTVRNPNHPNEPITYRMLLAHTAGLQEGSTYSTFLGASAMNPNAPPVTAYTNPGGSYYAANNWRTETPGTYFNYSNAHYGLIGTLIEKLANKRFDQFMRLEVFEPLGLTCSFNIHDLSDISDLGVCYRKQNGVWTPQIDDYNGIPPFPVDFTGYPIAHNGFVFGPQGSLRASARDLAVILQMMVLNGTYNGTTILQPGTVELMRTPAWTYNGSNGNNYYGLFRSWGLGMHISTLTPGGDIVYFNATMIGHPGEAYGLISDLYFDTAKKAGIILIISGAFNGYALGSNSAFYEVEESIFAQGNINYNMCTVSPATTPDTQAIRVFPQPHSKNVEIQLSEHHHDMPCFVIDQLGKVILRLQATHTNPVFDTHNWPAGTYYLVVGNQRVPLIKIE